jgi:hypothetical protein
VILGATAALLGRVEPARPLRALYALLSVTLAFAGGFPPMPWHTVDGILWSVLSTWAFVASLERRRAGLMLLAGLAAGAAALSKQGFVVIPLVGSLVALVLRGGEIGRRPWAGTGAYGCGIALAGLVTGTWLGARGALGAAVQAIVRDPAEITREVSVLRWSAWELLVGIHLPHAVAGAAGLVLLGLVALDLPRMVRVGIVLASLGTVAAVFWGWDRLVSRVFLVELFASAAWLGGLVLVGGHALGRLPTSSSSPALVVLALATLYASEWSYVPRLSGAQGLVLALPVVLLALPRRGRAVGEGAAASALAARRFPGGAALLYGALFAALLQATMPGTRGPAVVPFESERLRGILAVAPRVRGVDAVVALIRRETAPGDHVLAFMNFPALYFLTERRNPTRVDWFIPIELTRAEVGRAVEDLRARPPRLVILTTHDPSAMIESPRLRPILGYLLAHYREAEAIGEFLVLRPRGPAPV